VWLSRRPLLAAPGPDAGERVAASSRPALARLEDREQAGLVLEAVRRLDAVDQEVFQAAFRDLCTTRETAARLQALFDRPFSMENVRTRRHRIRLRVAAYLARRNLDSRRGRR
jgi:hypothetical protein